MDLTRKRAITLVKLLAKQYFENQRYYALLRTTLMVVPESRLMTRPSELFDALMKFVSEATGIQYEVIEWFVYECECGRVSRMVTMDGVEFNINSVKAFVDCELPRVK